MKKLQLFNVVPQVPEEIAFLETLSRNLWWSWNHNAIELFNRISPELWRKSGNNPLVFLSRLTQEQMETLARDDAFVNRLFEVREAFEAEVVRSQSGDVFKPPSQCIAYFSLEYGIHESVRLYSGGLGILAGGHLKAASDLNLPLVAVGLLYRHAYFKQFLDQDGVQREMYPENELFRMPVHEMSDKDHRQVLVRIPLPDGELNAQVWRIDVGRVPLYLLDTDIPENTPDLRAITGNLYGSDRQVRLRQELLLGIGGIRALLALGHDPVVCHMNEGHAAFISLARIAHLRKNAALDLDTATEVVRRSNVFTTHTPIPAGNETFESELLERHVRPLEENLGIDPSKVIDWGRTEDSEPGSEYSMTILGLRMADHINGVSELHGQVARRMWMHLWPERPEDEIPIRHITNGAHLDTWLSSDNRTLFDRYLGPEWGENPESETVQAAIDGIPDEELWRVHERSRTRLVRTARELVESQYVARGATKDERLQLRSVLDYDVLTVGFARRFATYKRAGLILSDKDRLEALLCDKERPVQLIFSGKAHPADEPGKELIREIFEFAGQANVRRRVVFLENYDMFVARLLVQGVDIWLNTPRRPHEASGTSGLKAAMNGGLNVSTLDGWWCEGYSPECGWAIGEGEEYEDPEYQDMVESQALYNLLESDVASRFYNRSEGDIPREWTTMMKASIKMAIRFFTSRRMVSEYNSTFYQEAWNEYHRLIADGAAAARELVTQRQRLQSLWQSVSIGIPVADTDASRRHLGDHFDVTTEVHLGDLRPDEVVVQLYYGPVDPSTRVTESHAIEMKVEKELSDGRYLYGNRLDCSQTGRFGFTARVIPSGKAWTNVMPGFLTWADDGGQS
jgi:starch phosphorylase